jgi:hypothetical protein
MGIKEVGVWGMVFLWTAGLCAQTDLVSLQKKEKERRKKLKVSTHILTDETRPESIEGKGRYNLTTVGLEEQAEGAQTGQEAAGAQTVVESQPMENSNPEEEKSFWVEKKRAHAEMLEQQREKIQALELQLERLVISRASEANPVKYNEMAQEIDRMGATLEEEKNRLADIDKEWKDVLKDAREKGIPSHWLED